jgi:hypothetical protein
MDTVHTFPVKLQEGEQIKYTHPNVKIAIKGDDEIVLVHGSLTLTTARVLYIQSLPRKICIFFKYQNCVTHATDKQNLVCMLSDLQDEDPFVEEDEEENQNKQPDPVLEQIKVVDSLEPDQWIQLAGNYQIIFHYGELGQEKLKEVFKIFSECSTLNPDEGGQLMNPLSMLAGDFITSANMNGGDQELEEEFEAEEGGYEDDDEGLGDMQQGTKKTKGEGSTMNVE